MIIFSKKFVFILFIILFFDFIFSNLLFKKTAVWDMKINQKKPWRVASKDYHHDLLPMINVNEYWGNNQQSLITNSLGFRDATNKIVEKKSKKRRILLVGDSFIEGLGYDYEFTLAGLLQNHYQERYEVLNSAVSSYSPSIYYFKIKHLIDQGYVFNEILIFLDVSDIIDENFLDLSSDGTFNVYEYSSSQKSIFKKIFYKSGHIMRENFVIFRFLYKLSDLTEILKNFVKDKYRASISFNKSFFNIDDKDLNLYRMINVDRGNWTKNTYLSQDAKKGIASSKKYLTKLALLLKENNIEANLIIYPWPTQIFYEDFHHQKLWFEFAKKNDLNFLNLYPEFDNKNKSLTIFNNFILGDVHWNKKGTMIVFNALKKSGIF